MRTNRPNEGSTFFGSPERSRNHYKKDEKNGTTEKQNAIFKIVSKDEQERLRLSLS